MKYLNKLNETLQKLEVIVKGCSKEEILKIEKVAGNKLPNCYIEFLEIGGKDMDRKESGMRGFLVGNAVFYEDLFDNKEGLQELLDEDESSLKIPENSFVFYCSQGILYAFFKLNVGDNPAVYGYSEGFEGNDFPKIADTLSEFYERYLEGYNDLFKELYNK